MPAEPRPLPAFPLRKIILGQYAGSMRRAAGEQTLPREELLDYLGTVERFDLPPLRAVLAQTDAIGDPALPEPPQMAILEWIGDAFELWRREYPLEEPLAGQLRQLQPMVAAVAITDPDFLTPGQHPLHRLLDSLQEYAVGWQPSLGRAGHNLERQVGAIVETCRGWFRQFRLDLHSITTQFIDAAERDRARARRMTQRLVESELGQQRAAEARREAAHSINAELMQYDAPAEVGAFLKGPWFESAQLVLLKSGADSEEWARMAALTATLLRSVQPNGLDREQLYSLLASLPGELKRWLVSLQHDPSRAEEAVRPLEAAHLQLMRGAPLPLCTVDPLLITDTRRKAAGSIPSNIQALQPGGWFRLNGAPEDVRRVQLALRNDDFHELLFVNTAGAKALTMPYSEFSRLLDQKRAVPLAHGASFSRCLVRAAGIESMRAFEALAAEERRRREAQQRELSASAAAPAVTAEAVPEPPQEPVKDSAQEPAQELLQAPEVETVAAAEPPAAPQAAAELPELDLGGSAAAEPGAAPPEPAAPAGNQPQEQELPELPRQQEAEHDPLPLDLPMGAWLGFHDGEAPLMARLAVHDPEQDLYIFVNRTGIKLRQLTGDELRRLVEQDLVDVLETRSTFRANVNRVRELGDDRE